MMKSIFSSLCLICFFALIYIIYTTEVNRRNTPIPQPQVPVNSLIPQPRKENEKRIQTVPTALEMPKLKIIRLEGVLSRDRNGYKYFRDVDSNIYWFASVKDSFPEDFGKLSEYEGWVNEVGEIKFFTATLKTR
jgi:hypothetical protein